MVGAEAKSRLLNPQQGASFNPVASSASPNTNNAKALITQPQSGLNPSMAGQCRPGKIFKEVTLKGGVNAGTYKDVGEVASIDDCSKRCCEYSACDLAFLLQKRCYLVGCSDGKNCKFQKARPSPYHPMLTYVTRWNSEGVKHAGMQMEVFHLKDRRSSIDGDRAVLLTVGGAVPLTGAGQFH